MGHEGEVEQRVTWSRVHSAVGHTYHKVIWPPHPLDPYLKLYYKFPWKPYNKFPWKPYYKFPWKPFKFQWKPFKFPLKPYNFGSTNWKICEVWKFSDYYRGPQECSSRFYVFANMFCMYLDPVKTFKDNYSMTIYDI